MPLRRGPDDARAAAAPRLRQKIAELYSPDSRTLAVASHDQFIDLYDAEDDLRGCTLPRHPPPSRIDWSVDCKVTVAVRLGPPQTPHLTRHIPVYR